MNDADLDEPDELEEEPEPEPDELEEEPEPESDQSEEPPEIDPEDMADLSDVTDQIAEETRPEGESGTQTPDETPEDTDADADIPSSDVSIGKIYTNMLGMGAAVARDELGSGVDDRKQAMQEYGDLARDLEIDDYVDEWMAQHGGPDALSPGQALIVMSVAFCGMVAMDDPDIMDQLIPGGENDE